MGVAIAEALGRHGDELLPGIAAALKDPATLLASRLGAQGARTYWLMAAVRDCAEADARVIVVEVRTRAGSRGPKPIACSIEVFDRTAEEALRLRLEDVYRDCADGLRVVRLRGRRGGPPVAVWVGDPERGWSNEMKEKLAAAAAVDGYELRVVPMSARAPGLVEQAVTDARPELVLRWTPTFPSAKLLELVEGAAAGAELIDLEAGPDSLLDEARAAFSAVTVEYFEQPFGGPESMVAAVERAVEDVEYLDITGQARRRAKDSAYKAPGAVLAGLKEIDRLAGMYRAGYEGSMKKLFLDHSDLSYADGLSQATYDRWKDRYTVDWNGKPRLMGPHVRFGSAWTSESCARVYWYVDSESRTWVVGHVGRHLPGARD